MMRMVKCLILRRRMYQVNGLLIIYSIIRRFDPYLGFGSTYVLSTRMVVAGRVVSYK